MKKLGKREKKMQKLKMIQESAILNEATLV